MTSLKTIILEDEVAPREILKTLLLEHASSIDIIQTFAFPEDARSFLITHHKNIDLLFLDVRLANQSGIEFMKSLPFIPAFDLIFATAYEEYMAAALNDFGAIYYLLKPYSSDKVKEAVEKVVRKKQGLPIQPYLADRFSQQKDYENGYAWYRKDVICLEADGYITNIYLSGSKRISLSKNLSYFEEKYIHSGDSGFFRCSRKHIINLTYIRKILSKPALISGKMYAAGVELQNRQIVGISYSRLKMFKNAFPTED